MREIKFRIYSVKYKEVIDSVCGFVVDPKKERLRYYRINNQMNDGIGTDVGDIGDFILMQYTGFKDKNGKEIYEGDVLSDITHTDDGPVRSKMQVFWCSKMGAWRLDNSFNQDQSSGDLLYDELESFVYEVIGSIHQEVTK